MRRWRQRIRRGWLVVRGRWRLLTLSAICLAGSFLLETGPQLLGGEAGCSPEDYQSILSPAYYYHRWTRLNRPTVHNQNTRVISISPESEGQEAISTPCKARALHARIVSVLAALRRPPAVIILDYTYRTDYCADKAPESQLLQKALLSASLAGIPVALGLSDLTQDEIEDERRQAAFPRRLKADESVLDSLQWRPLPESPTVRYGLVRVRCDVERLALGWPAYVDDRLQQFQVFPTLAKAAISAYGPGSEDPQLAALEKAGWDVFVPFLAEKEIRAYPARRVLARDPAVAGDLASRFVIICDFVGDSFASPVGKIPGGLFHANYIESVLSSSYFRPVPGYWTLLVSAAWFAAIELIFRKLKDSVWKPIAAAVAATGVFVAVFFVVVARLFNCYMLLWPPSAAFIAGKSWGVIEDRLRGASEANGRPAAAH
ncbi:MAG TPA: CHASE2 domain-containing protein [Bryobacteraceae bacterium]|nr:CHASE2 domain-containing protein [Bryobacteraceae bacterium]